MVGLIVAVKADAFRRKARCQRCIQLSFRNDIQSHLLCIHDAANLFAAEGFAGIADHSLSVIVCVNTFLENLAVTANHIFIHDIQRCAVLLCQCNSVYTANCQISCFVDIKIVRYKHFYTSFLYAAMS